MEVRIATMEDLDQLARMYVDLMDFRSYLQPRYYQAPEDGSAYPRSLIEGEDTDILVAVKGGRIMGFANMGLRHTPPYDSIVPRKYAYMIDMDAAADTRGQGVGSTLIEAAKKWAIEKGVDTLELHVLTGNDSAQRLYEKKGFEVISQTMRMTLE